jgi:hypothetical protein
MSAEILVFPKRDNGVSPRVYDADSSGLSDGCLSIRVGDRVTVWPLTSIQRYVVILPPEADNAD